MAQLKLWLPYELNNRGIVFRFPACTRDLSSLVYGPFNLVCVAYRGYFPEFRRPEREDIHSRPSRNDVKSKWHYSTTPPCDCKLSMVPSCLLYFLDRGGGHFGTLRVRINCFSTLYLKLYRLKSSSSCS